MTKVIAFLKNKGGVGCTTNAYNLATFLARRGKSVLVLDGDMQGDSTALMRVKAQPGMYNLLVNGVEWDAVWVGVPGEVYGNPDGMLYIVPSDEPSGIHIAERLANESVVAQRLAEVQGRFDVVIVDTSPSASDFHAGLYLAADYVIYPTQCQTEAVNALKRSLNYYENYRSLQTAAGAKVAALLGILPTMFHGRELVEYQYLGRLQERWEELVFPQMRYATTWKQAASRRLPLFIHDPKSAAAKEALAVYERIEAVL